MSQFPTALGRSYLAAHRGLVRARAKGFSLLVGGAFHSFGDRSVVEPPVRLSGEWRITIGTGVFVGSGSWLQVVGSKAETDLALTIGDGTSLAGRVVLSATHSITLGRNVLVAGGVYVADHVHAHADPRLPILAQGVADERPVVIEDGAWLGQNVVVGPGVRIGRGAVIGANSVVLGDVPDHAVAVGAPARVARRQRVLEAL